MNPLILYIHALAAGLFICQNKMFFDHLLKVMKFVPSYLLKNKNSFFYQKKFIELSLQKYT